ncbi:hypothetical protein AB4Y42_02380 [Paraburkholderia sp. EG286B]|uniref:hypothetical protein n=1 Tax=Paraburkholderia sp. EG286B TaxID=3237011 RepID=UPI0034D29A22
MTIYSKDFATKGYDYKIDLASERGGIWLDRTFTLKTTEAVTVHVQLKGREGMNLVDLHRESIQRAIDILQAALNPENAPEQKPGSLASQLA